MIEEAEYNSRLWSELDVQERLNSAVYDSVQNT